MNQCMIGGCLQVAGLWSQNKTQLLKLLHSSHSHQLWSTSVSLTVPRKHPAETTKWIRTRRKWEIKATRAGRVRAEPVRQREEQVQRAGMCLAWVYWRDLADRSSEWGGREKGESTEKSQDSSRKPSEETLASILETRGITARPEWKRAPDLTLLLTVSFWWQQAFWTGKGTSKMN